MDIKDPLGNGLTFCTVDVGAYCRPVNSRYNSEDDMENIDNDIVQGDDMEKWAPANWRGAVGLMMELLCGIGHRFNLFCCHGCRSFPAHVTWT